MLLSIAGSIHTTAHGWGQGGAGVTTAPAGEVVDVPSANGFKDLQDDVQAMCAFLGVSVRTWRRHRCKFKHNYCGGYLPNLMLNIQDCWNPLSPNSRIIATDGSTTFGSSGQTV